MRSSLPDPVTEFSFGTSYEQWKVSPIMGLYGFFATGDYKEGKKEKNSKNNKKLHFVRYQGEQNFELDSIFKCSPTTINGKCGSSNVAESYYMLLKCAQSKSPNMLLITFLPVWNDVR